MNVPETGARGTDIGCMNGLDNVVKNIVTVTIVFQKYFN